MPLAAQYPYRTEMRLRGVLLLIFAFGLNLSGYTADGRWETHGPYGGRVFGFTSHASNPRIVFAESQDSIFRSNNFGRAWHRINPNLISGYPKVRIFPGNPNFVIAASDYIYLSVNSGKTWRFQGSFRSIWNAQLDDMQFHSKDANTLYAVACCGAGIAKTVDSGRSWRHITAPAKSWLKGMLAVDPVEGNTVYLTLNNRIFKSLDEAESWNDITPAAKVQAPNILLVHPQNNQLLLVGDGGGILRSINGGKTWMRIQTGSPVFDISIDPDNSSQLYATFNRGILRSTDAGNSWGPFKTPANAYWLSVEALSHTLLANSLPTGIVRKDDNADWENSNRGFNEARINGTEVNSARPQEILTNAEGSTLYRTTNGGMQWQTWTTGRFARFHPQNPDLSAGAGRFKDEESGKIFSLTLSYDDGKTWIYRGPHVGGCCLNWDPANQNTFYFATSEAPGRLTLNQTTDQGITWNLRRSGLKNILFIQTAINPSILYLADHPRSLLRSTDTGATWKNMFPTTEIGTLGSIVVDPTRGTTLYMSLETGSPIITHLYKSTDAGEHWLRSDSGLPRESNVILSMAIDPFHPDTIYAGLVSAVYVSRDGAGNWNPLPSAGLLPFEQIQTLTVGGTRVDDLIAGTLHGIYRFLPD